MMPELKDVRNALKEALETTDAAKKTSLIQSALALVGQIEGANLHWTEMDALQVMKNLGAYPGHVVAGEQIGKQWQGRTPQGDLDNALGKLVSLGLLDKSGAGHALTHAGYNY